MRFDKPEFVDAICYDLKLADYPRGLNRGRINDLFNGAPPYTAEEVKENNIAVNVNDLTSARLGHDARMQFYGAFQKPGRFFKASSDMGPKDKREARSSIVTTKANRIMKREIRYFECMRSKFALDVLHGIGPSYWDTQDFWCPDALGIEDILVPARTLLTMKNLPYVAFYRNYTHNMLRRIMRKLDNGGENPGWNLDMLKSAIAWIEEETASLAGSTWPEVWSPEKRVEAAKEDGGLYGADRVPTVDVFDFWFWSDEGGVEGWSRRIILDTWGTPVAKGAAYSMAAESGRAFGKNQFLFNSGSRKVARKWQEIFSVQFADLSAVAPFRWHSVRSLGWLLYAPCHMLNRQRCKVAEAVFRDLMVLFRVKDQADAQRALQVNLVDRGFVDETISFIPPAERHQVNEGLVEFGMQHQKELIDASAGLFTQSKNYSSDRTEKTKFQVMAELNAAMNLVSAAFQQAYEYQKFEYYEIVRRLMMTDTRDPDAKRFRADCLSEGVPEEMLVPEAWDIEPERIMGGGNKTMELAIAEQLMAFRPQYDPDSQRKILRDVTYAITDDPARAEDLVPDEPLKVTDSVHDAQLSAGALMQGLPVAPRTGQNHTEVIATLLVDLQMLIAQANQQGGMMPAEKQQGCGRIVEYIQQHIQFLAQDKESKPLVAAFGKQLGKLVNELRAFGQRLQEAMKKQAEQQGGNGQLPPEQLAKIATEKIKADAKVQSARESHASRTAQKQVTWEKQEQQKDAAFQREQARLDAQTQAELVREGAKSAQEIAASRMKGMEGDE